MYVLHSLSIANFEFWGRVADSAHRVGKLCWRCKLPAERAPVRRETPLTSRSLDTAGTEQFGKLWLSQSDAGDPSAEPHSVAMRDLYMKTGQGFLLVFSITSQSSLYELASLREEIIRIKDDEDIPMVIVGNKSDLEDQRAVARTKVFSISQQWGAPYYEASARTRSK